MSNERVSRKRLASEISALRREMKWTQVELGEALGVAGATVSRWEGGKSIPEPEHLERLANLHPGFGRYFGILEHEHLERSVSRASGVSERHRIGHHDVVLLNDGTLRINGHVWIRP